MEAEDFIVQLGEAAQGSPARLGPRSRKPRSRATESTMAVSSPITQCRITGTEAASADSPAGEVASKALVEDSSPTIARASGGLWRCRFPRDPRLANIACISWVSLKANGTNGSAGASSFRSDIGSIHGETLFSRGLTRGAEQSGAKPAKIAGKPVL